MPDKLLVKDLPNFRKQDNEVEVADSMNDVDPTWVLGAIVETKTGKVRGLDSFLSKTAQPIITPHTELVFKDFVENSLNTSGGWLDFLKAQVDDTIRVEVSVVKTSKTTIKSSEIDRDRVINECKTTIPVGHRDKYAVIIGYIDFVLTAGLFKNFGTEAYASGYGAKIGGKWYSKFENTAAQHRVIAICSPLPLVLEAIQFGKMNEVPVDFESATKAAIREGRWSIAIPRIELGIRGGGAVRRVTGTPISLV